MSFAVYYHDARDLRGIFHRIMLAELLLVIVILLLLVGIYLFYRRYRLLYKPGQLAKNTICNGIRNIG